MSKTTKFIKDNTVVVSVILILLLVCVDIINSTEPYYSINELFYHLRMESDLSGLLGFFVILLVQYLFVLGAFNAYFKRRFLLFAIFLIFTLLFQIPILHIGMKI